MFEKVKNILGIEGVKVSLIVPEIVNAQVGKVGGIIKFTTLSDQFVEGFSIKMVEKYSRGKKESALINEYILGHITNSESFAISKGQIVEFDFELPFVTGKSEMDQYENNGLFPKLLAKAAKYLKNVKSEYKLMAEVEVKGTTLSPVATQIVDLRV